MPDAYIQPIAAEPAAKITLPHENERMILFIENKANIAVGKTQVQQGIFCVYCPGIKHKDVPPSQQQPIAS